MFIFVVMKEKNGFNLRHPNWALRLLFAVLGAILVAWILPGEVRFKYEFEKGQPWLHPDLYAPFDFSILKKPEELEAERIRIQQTSIPFFERKDSVEVSIRSEIANAIADAYPILSVPELVDTEQQIMQLLRPVLTIGILEKHPSLDSLPDGLIRVVNEHKANDVGVEEVYDLQKAVDVIVDNGISLGLPDTSHLIAIAVENLQPSLFYSSYLTKQELDHRLQSVSLAYGKVSRSELIISKGELVTDDTYRKLESLKEAYEERASHRSDSYWIWLAQLMLTVTVFVILYSYLSYYRSDVRSSGSKYFFVLTSFTLFTLLGIASAYVEIISIYMLPIPLFVLLLRNFFDAKLAIFLVFMLSISVGLIAPNGYEFVFIQSITGIVAAISMNNLRKRAQLLWITLIVFLSYSIVYLGFTLLKEGSPDAIEWQNLTFFAISAGLSLLTYPLVFLFEKLFRLVSEVTLLELSDTNNPLLRSLLDHAPGTFQHSLQVANLAEDAALHIGARALLTRTGALYHDIGKIEHPALFIENQVGEVNPHDELDPEQSAKSIIAHVSDGIKLANKHTLPKQLVDFIATHHGTSAVRYFLFKAKEQQESIDETIFHYPGPKPFTKETAILMMADSVEAASRSLKDHSIEKIDKLVEDIIDFQRNDGQFDEAPITFAEITAIKKVFKQRLQSLYHNRVAYPENKG